MAIFVYLTAMVYSGISSIRIPTIALGFIVILAMVNSLADQSQGWGVYHYYVGAKYFKEIGYFDLYECTVTESLPRRDLYTYNYRNDRPDCNSHFSPERYESFQQDIVSSGYYPQALIDKGYNGTPTWTAIFGGLANLNIITPHNAYLIDIIVMVSAFFACVYYIGWRKSLYIAIVILTYHGTMMRLWGHYAQWVWLGSALGGVVLLERKNAFGAILLGISTSLAIFPIFLMLRYLSAKNLIIFSVGLATMLTIGIANGRGLDGYVEFVDNMRLHSSYVRSEGCCDVGLTHTLALSQYTDDTYLQCFVEWEDSCPLSYERSYNPIAWLMLLPLVLTTPLGAMYGLLALSTYYYLILSVIPVWYSERWTRLLLIINVIFPAITIFISQDLFGYRHWIYFVYFVTLGVFNVDWKTIPSTVQTAKQRLYSTATAWNVSR